MCKDVRMEGENRDSRNDQAGNGRDGSGKEYREGRSPTGLPTVVAFTANPPTQYALPPSQPVPSSRSIPTSQALLPLHPLPPCQPTGAIATIGVR